MADYMCKNSTINSSSKSAFPLLMDNFSGQSINDATIGSVGRFISGADGLGIGRAKGEVANSWLDPGAFSDSIGRSVRTKG